MKRALFAVSAVAAAMLTAHSGFARSADTSTRDERMAGDAPTTGVIGWAAGRGDLPFVDAANEDRNVAGDRASPLDARVPGLHWVRFSGSRARSNAGAGPTWTPRGERRRRRETPAAAALTP